MPRPANLVKAVLEAIRWDESQQAVDLGKSVPVQFNPESLKVAFSNQNSGGDQSGGGAKQYVAKGTTKLSFDLWFDVTAPAPNEPSADDVRRLTNEVNFFMRPNEQLDGAPPGVRFQWGTFLFEGIMESMNETLEYFSEDGRPLRASVNVGLSQQEIQFKFGEQRAPARGGGASPGTTPLEPARAGDSVQGMAARAGRAEDWPRIADANGIENPRILPTGIAINTRL